MGVHRGDGDLLDRVHGDVAIGLKVLGGDGGVGVSGSPDVRSQVERGGRGIRNMGRTGVGERG
jgi:hypothetical protein